MSEGWEEKMLEAEVEEKRDHPPRLTFWRLTVDFYNQWPELTKVRKWNWINFDIIGLKVEVAPYKKAVEVDVALLGFSAVVTYWYEWWFGEEHARLVAGTPHER